jgi:heme-degrading monooxygenase HmoA
VPAQLPAARACHVQQMPAAAWKQVAEHPVAQESGKQVWYADYRVRVATVARDYGEPS